MATSQRAAPGRREQRSAPPVSDAPQLLEREHELEALDGVVAAAAEGAGQMLVVQGPPGVGKTRLLADARAGGRDADVLVLDGRGVELERRWPRCYPPRAQRNDHGAEGARRTDQRDLLTKIGAS